MNVSELKARWNDVLDLLERRDRIVWIAYFDARLASLENGVLTLQFIDAEKFAGAHDYSTKRSERMKTELVNAIQEVTGVRLSIEEI
jgi:hypothetical protein